MVQAFQPGDFREKRTLLHREKSVVLRFERRELSSWFGRHK
jgi:hypothetical protein